jgi:hypothetical protein
VIEFVQEILDTKKCKKKVGIIIIPPPIPNKPANTPENVPSKK